MGTDMMKQTILNTTLLRILALGYVLCFSNALNASTTSECIEGDQYRFYATDVEGERILMYATCIWNTEYSAFLWYRSNFDPFARSDN